MEEENTSKICCICKKPYDGYGNNAEPFMSGRCCDKCNDYYVIPYRILGYRSLLRRYRESKKK